MRRRRAKNIVLVLVLEIEAMECRSSGVLCCSVAESYETAASITSVDGLLVRLIGASVPGVPGALGDAGVIPRVRQVKSIEVIALSQ